MRRQVRELNDLSDADYARLVPAGTRLLAYRGSHTHGTYIPPTDEQGHDDVDLIAVYTDMRPSAYFGTDGQTWTGRDVKVGQWDGVCYQLQHFAKLAAACNPNVIQTLWLRAQHYLLLDWMGRELIGHRDMFTSRLAAKSFGGYAHGQLKRMTAFNVERAFDCPCTGDFHVDDCPLRAERGRGSTKLYATGFMGAKRKALVEKNGYDTKNAAHLIRLLRMGIEFLNTGSLFVWRDDAAELIAIKRGEWTLERVKAEADTLFAVLNERRFMSPLPETPDFGAINGFVTRIMCRALSQNIERDAWV
jgi:uncharacterized protein